MAMQMTFQEICTRHEAGFVCDVESMAPLTKRESFNDLVIKLASKCELDLVFLSGAKGKVASFSVDVVPEDPVNGTAITVTKSKGLLTKGCQVPSGYEAVAAAWQQCVARGYHGLHAITKLDASHMPDNDCRQMYSFAQFINSVVHSLEAYFMFLKANTSFRLNAMNLWETMEDLMMESCYLVLVWQYDHDLELDSAAKTTVASPPRRPLVSMTNGAKEPLNVKEVIQRVSPVARKAPAAVKAPEEPQPPVQQTSVNKRKSVAEFATFMKEPEEVQMPVVEKEPVKRAAPAAKKEPEPSGRGGKRGRRSIAPAKVVSEASADEEDEEISFKNKPVIMKPQVSYHPDMSPEKTVPKKCEPVEPEPPSTVAKVDVSLDDFTLGFEKPQVKSVGRKSTGGRKSLAPDWPEEEKEDVLQFFDNLNPSQTEQSQIALTCKYTSMKFSKELSSKQLYQWVQKKGREVNKTVTSYDLAESLHQETTLSFFHSLGTDLSEASRVSFTCKFMHTQFGVVLTSKTLYDWLSNKGKKSTRRR